MRIPILILAGLMLAGAAGCSLAPPATKDERARVEQAGKSYEPPFEQRVLPELPGEPDWMDVLQRAFLANGDLEAAYFEWRAAVERVVPASVWPNSDIQIGFSYAFGKGAAKGWNAATLSAGFDPAVTPSFPIVIEQTGKVALDAARAASKRFEAAKFNLQQKVLTAWLDYALTAEKVRIQSENLALLKSLNQIAARRVQAGGPQQDLLKVQTEYEMARNELANLQSELAGMRSMLNGMLARAAAAALAAPRQLPKPRTIPAGDAQLIAVAVRNNPELAALAHEVEGRNDSLELARLAYLPQISPQFTIEGAMQQTAGAMIVLPTRLIKIRGAIDEAQSNLRQTQAMLRQGRSDRAAQFVATLIALRNNERQAELLDNGILPLAKQTWLASTQAYVTGGATFADLIDTQRTLLQVRLTTAEAHIAREKRLAELETLAGVDVETLAAPTATAPATRPATRPAATQASRPRP